MELDAKKSMVRVKSVTKRNICQEMHVQQKKGQSVARQVYNLLDEILTLPSSESRPRNISPPHPTRTSYAIQTLLSTRYNPYDVNMNVLLVLDSGCILELCSSILYKKEILHRLLRREKSLLRRDYNCVQATPRLS